MTGKVSTNVHAEEVYWVASLRTAAANDRCWFTEPIRHSCEWTFLSCPCLMRLSVTQSVVEVIPLISVVTAIVRLFSLFNNNSMDGLTIFPFLKMPKSGRPWMLKLSTAVQSFRFTVSLGSEKFIDAWWNKYGILTSVLVFVSINFHEFELS